MNFLGIDYGSKRIGLSTGDDELRFALPLGAILAETFESVTREIAKIVAERKIAKIIIGYPLNMNGSIGYKAKEVESFVEKLKKQIAVPIIYSDERLSSESVEDVQKHRSIKNRQFLRKSGIVDSRAATIILQDYFDEHLRDA